MNFIGQIHQDYQDYVVIITNTSSYNFGCWYDTQHSTYTIFTCNDCSWNILIKYIISGIDHTIQTELTWNSAQIACNTLFGTSLASIHNNSDNEAAKLYFYFYDNI